MEISNFKIECSGENGRREGIKVSKEQNRKIFCQAISKEVYVLKIKNNWPEDEPFKRSLTGFQKQKPRDQSEKPRGMSHKPGSW